MLENFKWCVMNYLLSWECMPVAVPDLDYICRFGHVQWDEAGKHT